MQFCELTKEEYSTFQMKHEYCNFLNGVETIDLEEKEGYPCSFVGMKEAGEVICATSLVKFPMMKKFSYFYAPRGILIDYRNVTLLNAFVKELKAYMKKAGAIQFVMDPYILYKERDIEGDLVEGGFDNSDIVENLINAGFIHKGFTTGYGHTMQTIRWMYSMYLDGKEEATLWKELHSQTRWSINRTLRFQVQIKELGVDELHIFEDIMNKTGERRSFGTRQKSFYTHQLEAYKDKMKVVLAYMDIPLYKASLQKELDAKKAEIEDTKAHLEQVPNSKKFIKKLRAVSEEYEATLKKMEQANMFETTYGEMIPLAASMFSLYKDEITYLTSGAYEEFRDIYAPYAIQWYMIKYALKHGYTRYNFYGINGVFDPNDPNYGVYKFKKGFPGKVEELIGDFVLPVNSALFKIYNVLKNR